MYNYPFRDNEEYVLSEEAEVNCQVHESNMLVNILLTNKNILIFKEKNNTLKSGEIHTMLEFEVCFKVPLNNMDYTINKEDTILNIDNDVVTLYNLNIKDFIEKDD